MDPDMFFSRVRKFLIELLAKESRTGAVRSQAMTGIRFRKDGKTVELAFNSRMLNIYNLSDMNEIVNGMITHMAQQIENSALSDSNFVFDEVVHMDVDFHRLNLPVDLASSPTRLVSSQESNNKPKEFRSRMFQMGSNCSYEVGRDR